VSYVHPPALMYPEGALVVLLPLIKAFAQSRKPHLGGQVELRLQGFDLLFDTPEPRTDVGCNLLTEVPGAHR
jgi:hypothetical protein